MISVIISSRSNLYLQKTVDDVLNKAKGEVEVIVVLDGYWPEVLLKDDKRVIVIHHGELRSNFGLRTSVNRGVSVSRGEYIMKIDDHCALDEGFDVKLVADCMLSAGACYFMKRSHWNKLGLLDEKNYGAFPSLENLEVCLKTWLSGGRVVTNKKTWCAHRWGERGIKSKGWNYSNNQTRKSKENR